MDRIIDPGYKQLPFAFGKQYAKMRGPGKLRQKRCCLT